jgi:HNH endonuclease.
MKCSQRTCTHEVEDAQFKQCQACRERKNEWNKRNIGHIREYERATAERINERKRARYWANIEKSRERCRTWVQEHYEERREQYHQYYQDNKEKCNERNERWRIANIGKKRTYTRNYRARKLANGGELPIDAESILFEAQDGLCYLCGKLLHGSFDDLISIEHKIPVSRGGSNDLSNVALAHLKCNQRKGTRTPEEFIQTRQLFISTKESLL